MGDDWANYPASVQEEVARYSGQLQYRAERVVAMILGSGREMWVEDNQIRIYPRLARLDRTHMGWIKDVGELRNLVIKLLPSARQGAESL